MSILDEILSHKRTEVAQAKREVSVSALQAELSTTPTRKLSAALRRPEGAKLRFVAEIKRASPTAGTIRGDANPAEIAQAYGDNGASAISVLTDEKFFAGHLSFLQQVRDVVPLPLLRKDFIIDPYQVVQSRVAGADAILLIVAALDDGQLSELFAAAEELALETLVEIHDEQEADRAVRLGARLIGVNHRNLHTFAIDLDLTRKLASRLAGCVMVAESGVRTHDDLKKVACAPADALLIGEALMCADSPGQALRDMVASS